MNIALNRGGFSDCILLNTKVERDNRFISYDYLDGEYTV